MCRVTPHYNPIQRSSQKHAVQQSACDLVAVRRYVQPVAFIADTKIKNRPLKRTLGSALALGLAGLLSSNPAQAANERTTAHANPVLTTTLKPESLIVANLIVANPIREKSGETLKSAQVTSSMGLSNNLPNSSPNDLSNKNGLSNNLSNNLSSVFTPEQLEHLKEIQDRQQERNAKKAELFKKLATTISTPVLQTSQVQTLQTQTSQDVSELTTENPSKITPALTDGNQNNTDLNTNIDLNTSTDLNTSSSAQDLRNQQKTELFNKLEQQLKRTVVPVTPTKTPSISSSQANTTNQSKLNKVAYRYVGLRYRLGGTGKRGIDCSAYTRAVMRQMGVSLPRTARQQARVGYRVAKSNLQPGDLVFFNTLGRGVSHTGLYLGDGLFANANSYRGRVVVENLYTAYWNKRFVSARRVLA